MPRDPGERLTARAIREQRNILAVVVERLSSVGAVARSTLSVARKLSATPLSQQSPRRRLMLQTIRYCARTCW